MFVKAYKTNKIKVGDNLFEIFDKYLPKLEEKTIVIITSKIISISQGDVVKNDGKIDKKSLIKKEADLYIDVESDYGIVLPTIKDNILLANAGVDESNANGYFILWPKNIDESVVKIWEYLRNKNKIKNLGVIVTDSRLTPLSFGITGLAISWCGFEALQDYRGTPDIFGRNMKMSQKNIVNGLAGAAEVVMGEGSEQTPLGIIADLPSFVVFQNRPPTGEEKNNLRIELKNDVFGVFLNSVKWKKGNKK